MIRVLVLGQIGIGLSGGVEKGWGRFTYCTNYGDWMTYEQAAELSLDQGGGFVVSEGDSRLTDQENKEKWSSIGKITRIKIGNKYRGFLCFDFKLGFFGAVGFTGDNWEKLFKPAIDANDESRLNELMMQWCGLGNPEARAVFSVVRDTDDDGDVIYRHYNPYSGLMNAAFENKYEIHVGKNFVTVQRLGWEPNCPVLTYFFSAGELANAKTRRIMGDLIDGIPLPPCWDVTRDPVSKRMSVYSPNDSGCYMQRLGMRLGQFSEVPSSMHASDPETVCQRALAYLESSGNGNLRYYVFDIGTSMGWSRDLVFARHLHRYTVPLVLENKARDFEWRSQVEKINDDLVRVTSDNAIVLIHPTYVELKNPETECTLSFMVPFQADDIEKFGKFLNEHHRVHTPPCLNTNLVAREGLRSARKGDEYLGFFRAGSDFVQVTSEGRSVSANFVCHAYPNSEFRFRELLPDGWAAKLNVAKAALKELTGFSAESPLLPIEQLLAAKTASAYCLQVAQYDRFLVEVNHEMHRKLKK